MGFEFKHFAYLTVLICSLWALTVTALTSVEELGKIKFNSELPQEEVANNFESVPIEDKFEAIINVLNIGIPVALLAILLLIITYGTNPIGITSLGFAILVFLFSSSKAMDAAAIITATTEFSVDARVWWM
ncbi:MAG: hypothetical protein P1V20_31200 [Verrucomicrobiales bacterium]|nr:hypothetical protein [Verrucomicrobiales bacterium]